MTSVRGELGDEKKELPKDAKEEQLSSLLALKRGRSLKATSLGKVPMLPPKLINFPFISRCYGFQAPAATNLLGVTVGDLLGAAGVIGTIANSTVVAYHSAVRLRRIRIWPGGPLSGEGAPVLAEVFWNGTSGNIPDQQAVQVLPGGVTETSGMSYVPPKNTLADFWWDAADSATNVFDISLPQGSVVYVDMDLALISQLTPLSIAGFAIVAVGNPYFLALDGRGTNKITPIGLATTS